MINPVERLSARSSEIDEVRAFGGLPAQVRSA
jgi:hypothetical protein